MGYNISMREPLDEAGAQQFASVLERHLRPSRFRIWDIVGADKANPSLVGQKRIRLQHITLKYIRRYSKAEKRSKNFAYLEKADWVGFDLMLADVALEFDPIYSIKATWHRQPIYRRNSRGRTVVYRYAEDERTDRDGKHTVWRALVPPVEAKKVETFIPAAHFDRVHWGYRRARDESVQYITYPRIWEGTPRGKMGPDAVPWIMLRAQRGIYNDILPFKKAIEEVVVGPTSPIDSSRTSTGFLLEPAWSLRDTTPLLICADWLEERGRVEPAELLRIVCENELKIA